MKYLASKITTYGGTYGGNFRRKKPSGSPGQR